MQKSYRDRLTAYLPVVKRSLRTSIIVTGDQSSINRGFAPRAIRSIGLRPWFINELFVATNHEETKDWWDSWLRRARVRRGKWENDDDLSERANAQAEVKALMTVGNRIAIVCLYDSKLPELSMKLITLAKDYEIPHVTFHVKELVSYADFRQRRKLFRYTKRREAS